MSYITRNANLILLFLIVLIATSLVAATTYFQSRFDEINNEYTAKRAQLENVSKELDVYQQILQKAKEELQLKLAREEQFTEQYTEVKTTKEQLEADKARLLKEKKSLEDNLASTRTSLTQAQAEVSSQKLKVSELDKEVSSLDAQVSSLNSRISRLNSKIDCLVSKTDAEESSC